MDFGQRIKNLRLERGYTQHDISIKLGVSTVTVSAWERGSKKPSLTTLISLGQLFSVSIDALLGLNAYKQSVGNAFLSAEEANFLQNYRRLDKFGKKTVETVCLVELERVGNSQTPPAEVDATKIAYIPRYLSPSAAGMSAILDCNEFEMIPVGANTPANADFAINIQGDSMNPYIHDGDTVFVKRTEEISVGDVGIFCVDGAIYCKQYYKEDDGTLILASANPVLKNTNVIIPPDSNSTVKCYGVVLLNQHIELPSYLFARENS